MGTPFFGSCCCPNRQFDLYSVRTSGLVPLGSSVTAKPHRSSVVYWDTSPVKPNIATAESYTADDDWSDSSSRRIRYSRAIKRSSGGDLVFVNSSLGDSSGRKIHCFSVGADGLMVEDWSHDWDADLGDKIAISGGVSDLYHPILAVDESNKVAAHIINQNPDASGLDPIAEPIVIDGSGITAYTVGALASLTDENGRRGYGKAIAWAMPHGLGIVSGSPIVDDWPNFVSCRVTVENLSWGNEPYSLAGDFTLEIVKGEIDLTTSYHELKNVVATSHSWTTTADVSSAASSSGASFNDVLTALWPKVFRVASGGDSNSSPLPELIYVFADNANTITFTESYKNSSGTVTSRYRNYDYNGTVVRESISTSDDLEGWYRLTPAPGQYGVAASRGVIRYGASTWSGGDSGLYRVPTASTQWIYLENVTAPASLYTGDDPNFSTAGNWETWRMSYDQTIFEPLRQVSSGEYADFYLSATDGIQDVVQDCETVKHASGKIQLTEPFFP